MRATLVALDTFLLPFHLSTVQFWFSIHKYIIEGRFRKGNRRVPEVLFFTTASEERVQNADFTQCPSNDADKGECRAALPQGPLLTMLVCAFIIFLINNMNLLKARLHVFAAIATVASAFFLFFTTAPLAYAVDEFSVIPSTAATDNLIGATNAQWVFTATTTAEIATSSVIQLIFPNISQGAVPFSITGASVLATSSDMVGVFDLYTTPTGAVSGVVAAQSQLGPVVYGYATSTIPAGTMFSVTLTGITNATGQLSVLQNLAWMVYAGTPADPGQPESTLSSTAFNAANQTASRGLIRGGGALVSDVSSAISATSYATSTATSITLAIKTTTEIPIGGKIGINLPSEYSLMNATVTDTEIINGGSATVVNGAIATSTGQGVNRVILTTSGDVVSAGDILTVTINGLTNPATAGVYRPFSIFTMKANSGLLDGSYFGFEPADFGSGAPPPQDTLHVGGLNTIIIQVRKQSGGSTVALTGNELTSVKVGAGCPDKQFFIGERWLDASSNAQYDNALDCNYMLGVSPFDASDQSFYNNFLPPGFKSLNVVSSGSTGAIATTTLVFGVPNSTTTLKLTGGVAGQTAFIQAFSSENESYTEVFTDTTYATPGFDGSGNGYARVLIDSGKDWSFNVMGGVFGSGANFSNGAGAKLWPPVIPSIRLTAASTSNLGTFPYVVADKNLVVTLSKSGASGNVDNACVGVMRSGGGIFMGPQDMVCQTNYDSDGNSSLDSYRFKVPAGTITIQIDRGGFGAPLSYPVGITNATTTKTIALSSPTSYIVVNVETSGGTAINGAPVFAYGSSGFGNGMTSTTGSTTLYVSPGTYTVEGFAPAFGPLTAQTATVSEGSNPSVTFTVNTANLKTISGRVTQDGSGVAGIKIGAHGTGNTTGGNGTETDADGYYTLYVPTGTYEIGGWSADIGGLSPLTADVSSSNATGKNWSLSAQGTLHIEIQNSSNISPLFAGAFDATTGRGNGTDSWSASSTSKVANITLPAGTYDVHAGSPSLGEFGSQADVEITAEETINVIFNASASVTLVTLSGSVTASAVGVADVNVWASRVNGPGFFSTQTDENGDYSLQVPDGITYRVGARSLAYITVEGDTNVVVSGNATRDFTLSTAANTITGTVKNSEGTGIANGWVMAFKTNGNASSTQTGAPTDASGNYSLNVDANSTWDIVAEGPCYLRSTAISASADDTGKNITLAARSGCTAPTPEIHAITDSSGGQISQSNMTLSIPANALGTSQSSVSVSVSDASNAVASANATPLDDSVKTITASDSSGQSITTLNNNASLILEYDPAELPNGFDESTLQLAYFDSTTAQWEPVAATVDTTNNTLTAQISHFTDYGPILPGVPDAPTGLATASISASQINLSWTASPTADTYVIYRSLTDSGFTTAIVSGITGTTYSNDSGLSANTTYYYEVAGVNDNGEGPNSSSANAKTQSGPSGGSGESSGSSGGSIVSVVTTTTTATTATTTATSTTATATSTPVTVTATTAAFTIPTTPEARQALITELLAQITALRAQLVALGGADPSISALLNANPNASFKRDLKLGSIGEDVRALQVWLNAHGFTVAKSGPGSRGKETTKFGSLTKAALVKFQSAKGIKPSAGYFGPKTRAFLGANSQ